MTSSLGILSVEKQFIIIAQLLRLFKTDPSPINTSQAPFTLAYKAALLPPDHWGIYAVSSSATLAWAGSYKCVKKQIQHPFLFPQQAETLALTPWWPLHP